MNSEPMCHCGHGYTSHYLCGDPRSSRCLVCSPRCKVYSDSVMTAKPEYPNPKSTPLNTSAEPIGETWERLPNKDCPQCHYPLNQHGTGMGIPNDYIPCEYCWLKERVEYLESKAEPPQAVGGWIRIEDELPALNENVVFWTRSGYSVTGSYRLYRTEPDLREYSGNKVDATHWARIVPPLLPTEVK